MPKDMLFKNIIEKTEEGYQHSQKKKLSLWKQSEVRRNNWYVANKKKFEENINKWKKINKISEAESLILKEVYKEKIQIQDEYLRITAIINLVESSSHLNDIHKMLRKLNKSDIHEKLQITFKRLETDFNRNINYLFKNNEILKAELWILKELFKEEVAIAIDKEEKVAAVIDLVNRSYDLNDIREILEDCPPQFFNVESSDLSFPNDEVNAIISDSSSEKLSSLSIVSRWEDTTKTSTAL